MCYHCPREVAVVFETMRLPAERTVVAPDGSDVRKLLGLEGADLAEFRLAPGQISRPVVHRSVGEIWYCVDGRGQVWRRDDDQDERVDIEPGVCLTIPVGTAFQFRAADDGPLRILGVTMPPWPGDDEAYVVEGEWTPTQ
jgi:mannose-6-phosphate isomerase-like protein (cupin superfamily)